MSNQELQELLIKKIRQTDDNILLEEGTRLFNIEIDDSEVYTLSESEKTDLQEAKQQIINGESYSHEQANQLISEWLKK